MSEKSVEKKLSKLDKFFGVSEKKSTIRTEIIAGLVTFLAMAYILIVNPNSISNIEAKPAEWASVFVATAFGAIVGTLLMSLFAKMPLAQAPGLGLNSMVGGLIGGWGAFHCTLGNAMLLVLISGVLFVLLSIITIKGIAIRELIFDGIPVSIRKAISIGIGLFIAFIGCQNAGLIVDSPFTLVTKADLTNYAAFPNSAVVCLVGLLVITVLEMFKVKGAVIIGIIVATLVGIPFGVTTWNPGAFTWKFWEHFANFFSFNGSAQGGTFFAAFYEGFDWAEGTSIMSIVMTIVTFCMIDMFDTMGTVVGCTSSVGLVDDNGKPLNYGRIMLSDSIATVAGSLFGTSTVTTFVESGSGIAAGGRTGLTALTTAVCFFLSIFLMPLISSIPSAACSSALIYVGCLMLKNAKDLQFDTPKDTLASFMTIAMMPLAYSITDGIGYGVLCYIVVDVITFVAGLIFCKDKSRAPKWDLSPVLLIVGALFVVYFFVPTAI